MNSIKISVICSRCTNYLLPKQIAGISDLNNHRNVNLCRRFTTPSGIPGSGAGKGGGSGGSVRESGGGLGKYGAAQEDSYFYDKQKEQLEKIRKKLKLNPEISQKEDK